MAAAGGLTTVARAITLLYATASRKPMTSNSVADPTDLAQRSSGARVIIAASIGNMLEWFDFLIYGYFAVTLAKVFFPVGNGTVALLITFATFGLSYLVRPLGAIAIGAYTDRHGRRAGLTLSILLMMIGTATMAVVPGYATIGILAPLLVLCARLLQGFSVGGEFGSATAFLAEYSAAHKGFFASWQWASTGVTSLLASGFGVWLTGALTHEQLLAWGWRVPYLFGLLLGPIGLYIRRHIAETPEFTAIEPTPTPVRDLLRRHPLSVVLAIGASIISNSSFYLILYIPTYAIKQLHLPASTGFTATLIGAALLTVVCPLAGHWSDRIGRTPIMLAMAGLFLLTSYPVFALMVALPSLAAAVFAAGWLSLIKAGYSGVLPSLLAGLFPTETRGIGMSLSYSISVTIFGGFAPLIATSLIAATGNPLSPSFYLMFTALLSMLALAVVQRRVRLF
jgi:MHS family proline/betaine transporter-like MFS transporter